ncbi:MAG: NAD(P)-dependent oxidoreductase [Candidatus Omnitrophica bacterium]|nr:NAD(P)-dependent oxidoreductase [Candidatus Omnitrophota bacterium]
MGRRVLVLGAGGQLGMALVQKFQGAYEVMEAVHRGPKPGRPLVDLADAAGTLRLLDRLAPDWILIAGAYCNVDGCESEAELCRRVNVEGPRSVARWARGRGAIVVFYSTDHVFDGSLASASEESPVHPLNRYAQSKVEGEQAVREELPESHLILRTSSLYGPDQARKNFVLRLADRLVAGGTVRVASDQWGSPTATSDVAGATRFLLEKDRTGTFHAVGPDFLSRIDFAHRICASFGLDARRVIAVPTEELHQPARRPLRVRLGTRKLSAAGAEPFSNVELGLAALKGRP